MRCRVQDQVLRRLQLAHMLIPPRRLSRLKGGEVCDGDELGLGRCYLPFLSHRQGSARCEDMGDLGEGGWAAVGAQSCVLGLDCIHGSPHESWTRDSWKKTREPGGPCWSDSPQGRQSVGGCLANRGMKELWPLKLVPSSLAWIYPISSPCERAGWNPHPGCPSQASSAHARPARFRLALLGLHKTGSCGLGFFSPS